MVEQIILASGSTARQDMLARAGVAFSVRPARIDEPAIKAALLADGLKPFDIADALAEAKAVQISNRNADALVIGADQVLELDGVIFDKPLNMDQALQQLKTLRGKRHRLLSAVVTAVNGQPIWRKVGVARLHMKPFSDSFLDDYLARIGEGVLTTVGCYQLEDIGVRLFSAIEGDWFTILGMPLIDVLNYLEQAGLLER